jgi:hypothetical protein
MRNLHLPASLTRLRREAPGLKPELARLGDAVGDTLSAATAAATSTANDTARRIARRVRRQRPSNTRKRAFTLLALAGTGIALVLLTRRGAASERPTNSRARADAAGQPVPSAAAINDDPQVAPPSAPTRAEFAATAPVQTTI